MNTTHHTTQSVLSTIEKLNSSGIHWILLRNTNNEIPNQLPLHKDIDILVRHDFKDSITEKLLSLHFKALKNPLSANKRLYQVSEPLFFQSPDGILIDVAFEIFVQSTFNRILIPLHQDLQKSAWESSKIVRFDNHQIRTLSDEDMLVSLIARCIFDKRSFGDWHQETIKNIYKSSNAKNIKNKLELVFFKFTPRLIELIKKSKFNQIINEYIKFKEY